MDGLEGSGGSGAGTVAATGGGEAGTDEHCGLSVFVGWNWEGGFQLRRGGGQWKQSDGDSRGLSGFRDRLGNSTCSPPCARIIHFSATNDSAVNELFVSRDKRAFSQFTVMA